VVLRSRIRPPCWKGRCKANSKAEVSSLALHRPKKIREKKKKAPTIEQKHNIAQQASDANKFLVVRSSEHSENISPVSGEGGTRCQPSGQREAEEEPKKSESTTSPEVEGMKPTTSTKIKDVDAGDQGAARSQTKAGSHEKGD